MKFIPSLLILTLLTSCFDSKTKFTELENKFSRNLIDHMISRDFQLYHKIELYPNSQDTSFNDLNHNGAWAVHTYKVSTDEIDQLNTEFNLDNRSFSLDSQSNCINCRTNFNCSIAEMATPLFYFLRKKLNINSDALPDEFRIYHLESKQGEFIPKISLRNQICDNEWAHGYTKGLVLNRTAGLVTFWITIW